MPKNNIQKSLQGYLSKIKHHRSRIIVPSKKWISSTIKNHSSHIPSTKWMLSGCKHSRTSSLVIDNNLQDPSLSNKNVDDKKNLEAATLADIDRFLIENFKSLYMKDDEEISDTKRVHDNEDEESKQGPIVFGEPPSNLFYYNRFLMKGDKGTSSSTTSTTPTTTSPFQDSISSFSQLAKYQDNNETQPDCVVILACSENPYDEFHQSMRGMVEARLRNNEVVDWNFMEQLFFHYMNLNDKKSYKFILNAFVDLVAVMRPHWEMTDAETTTDASETTDVSETTDLESRARSVRTVRSSGELPRKNKQVM